MQTLFMFLLLAQRMIMMMMILQFVPPLLLVVVVVSVVLKLLSTTTVMMMMMYYHDYSVIIGQAITTVWTCTKNRSSVFLLLMFGYCTSVRLTYNYLWPFLVVFHDGQICHMSHSHSSLACWFLAQIITHDVSVSLSLILSLSISPLIHKHAPQ